MVLMSKDILPVGRFKVQTPNGRRWEEFTEARLQRIADTSNKMLREGGLAIPAPFDHHRDANPKKETEIAQNKGSESFKNGGYWTAFWVENVGGRPCLRGAMDAAGNVEQMNSPAWKAKNTNREVSISLNNDWEDGYGRTWTDGLMHVALVNQAVVPDQKPFEVFPAGTTIVNMSMMGEPGTDDESTIMELKAALQQLEIPLPASTDAKTFLRDLLVSVTAIAKSGGRSRLGGTELEAAPIYLSTGADDVKINLEAAQTIVNNGVVNPSTGKPYTLQDLGYDTSPQPTPHQAPQAGVPAQILASIDAVTTRVGKMEALLKVFSQKLKADAESSVRRRIEELVKGGYITREHADKELMPKVGFQMSIGQDGKIADHPLSSTLSTLENVAAMRGPQQGPAPGGFPSSAEVQPPPTYDPHAQSGEEIESLLNGWQEEGAFQNGTF